jgi:hypothetical protein
LPNWGTRTIPAIEAHGNPHTFTSLPFVVEFIAKGEPDEITIKKILLALEQRNRIRHVCLRMSVLKVQKLLSAIGGRYAQTVEGAAAIAAGVS